MTFGERLMLAADVLAILIVYVLMKGGGGAP